jgi:hypothetical protein
MGCSQRRCVSPSPCPRVFSTSHLPNRQINEETNHERPASLASSDTDSSIVDAIDPGEIGTWTTVRSNDSTAIHCDVCNERVLSSEGHEVYELRHRDLFHQFCCKEEMGGWILISLRTIEPGEIGRWTPVRSNDSAVKHCGLCNDKISSIKDHIVYELRCGDWFHQLCFEEDMGGITRLLFDDECPRCGEDTFDTCYVIDQTNGELSLTELLNHLLT